MKLRIIAVAALPLLLSGCAEVISFAAGFGAGYFTGQYMSESDKTAVKNVRQAQLGSPTRPMQGYPYYGQQPATPQGGYYSSDPYVQFQQHYQQHQQYYAQQMPQPYGVPQAPSTQNPVAAQPQATPAPNEAAAPTEETATPEEQAAEVKIIPATPQAQAAYQTGIPAPQQPQAVQPQMAQPQPMMQPMQPMQPQAGGGYYIAPIPMMPLQQRPPGM